MCCHHCVQILPCPPGAFCNSRGAGNFTECPPGTYQAQAGHSSCMPCEIGFFCPAQGLSEPVICAAGMVCSLPGLSFPDALCPPGHFCPPGVATLDPMSQTHWKTPLECPENTWCSHGIATNVSIPGNLSTPQPCIIGFVCFRGSDSPQGSGPCPTGYYWCDSILQPVVRPLTSPFLELTMPICGCAQSTGLSAHRLSESQLLPWCGECFSIALYAGLLQ